MPMMRATCHVNFITLTKRLIRAISLASGAKFSVPTVANGKVYVATTGGTVGAFGLFNPPRLANLSGEAYVGLESQARVLTGGFVVHGKGYKQVVLRALGPSVQVRREIAKSHTGVVRQKRHTHSE